MDIIKTQDMGLPRINLLVYGHPGTGKTTFATNTKGKVLIGDVEGGANFLGFRGIKADVARIKKWEDLKTFYKLALEGDYDTVVVDPIGELLDLLIEDLKANGYSDSKGESMTIQGWGVAKNKFKKYIRMLRDLDANVVLVSHTSEKKAEEMLYVRPKLAASLDEDVCAMMTVVGYLATSKTKEGETKRRMFFQPSDKYYAKDRTGALPEFAPDPTLDKVIESVHSSPMASKVEAGQQNIESFEKDLDNSSNE